MKRHILYIILCLVLSGCVAHGSQARIGFPSPFEKPRYSPNRQAQESAKASRSLPLPDDNEADRALPCDPRSRETSEGIETFLGSFKTYGPSAHDKSMFNTYFKQQTNLRLTADTAQWHYGGDAGRVVIYRNVYSKDRTDLASVIKHGGPSGQDTGPVRVVRSNGTPTIAFFDLIDSNPKAMYYNFWIFRQHGYDTLEAVGFWASGYNRAKFEAMLGKASPELASAFTCFID